MLAKALSTMALALTLSSPAFAHHARHFARHSTHHEQTTAPWWNGGASWRPLQASLSGRPSDCYGIRWCGCYLRHVLGLADKGLNKASNWASVGHNAGGPGLGVIVVWPHHVDHIIGGSPGHWVTEDGNFNHGVHVGERSLAGAIAFRQL